MDRYFIEISNIDNTLQCDPDKATSFFAGQTLDEFGFFYPSSHRKYLLKLSDLSGKDGAIIVAEAGMGKTYELEKLCDLCGADSSMFIRLSTYQEDASGLVAKIASIRVPFLFVDGLDESPKLIEAFLRGLKELTDRPKIFISSRNIKPLSQVSVQLGLPRYSLEPLSKDDLLELSKANNVSSDQFLARIIDLGLGSICSKPLGCLLYIKLFKNGILTSAKSDEMWEKGILALCEENPDNQSRNLMPSNPISAKQCRDYASKTALILKLSGKNIIWSGADTKTPNFSLNFECFFDDKFQNETFTETLHRGIYLPVESNCFRFFHMTIFDYLAAIGFLKYINPNNWESIMLSPDRSAVYPYWESVACWLAVHDENWRDLVLKIQPELLLTSDEIISLIGPGKLCDALIKRANDLDYWTRHGGMGCLRLFALKSPDTVHVLDNLFKSSTSTIEIEMGMTIAKECKCVEVEQHLVDIFCNVERDLRQREHAGYALCDFASENARRACKKILIDPQFHRTLKGLLFQLCWPDFIEWEEIAPHLIEPDGHLIDAYYSWIVLAFSQSLKDLDRKKCIELLNWVIKEAGKDKSHQEITYNVKKQIFTHCWINIADEETYGLLAQGLIEFNKVHESPFSIADSYTTPNKLLYDNNNFCQDIVKRRAVLDAMMDFDWCKGYEIGCLWRTELIQNNEELQYIFDKVENTTDLNLQKKWVYSLGSLWRLVDFERQAKMWDDVHNNFPDIIQSDSATIIQNQAKSKLEREKLEIQLTETKKRHKEEQIAIEKGNIHWIKGAIAAGNAAQYFSSIINVFLYKTGIDTFDFTTTSIWDGFTTDEHRKIILAANDFLLAAEKPQREDGSYAPVYSRAITMLFFEDKDLFASLPDEVWEKNTTELLRHLSFNNTEIPLPILEYINNNFPDIFRNSIVELLVEEAKNRSFSYSVEKIKDFLTAESWFKVIEDAAVLLQEEQLFSVLHGLSRCSHDVVLKYLSERYVGIGYSIQQCDLKILTLIAVFIPSEFSKIVAEAIKNTDWGKSWMEIVAECHDRYYGPRLNFESLPLNQRGEFYIWMENHYPSKDEPERLGCYHPSILHRIHGCKRDLFNAICNYDGIGKVAELQKILYAFPKEDWLKECIAKAKKDELKIISPIYLADDIKVLITNRDNQYLVSSPNDLLRLVMKLLNEYQLNLNGKRRPMVESLWDVHEKDTKPKCEDHFSDHIVDFLEPRIVNTGFFIGREVRLNSGRFSEAGARTDIWIQIYSEQKEKNFSLCIEVKGSWNSSAPTALKKQLVKKYMDENAADAGIFLVGWFDSEKYPQGSNQWKNNRDAAKEDLKNQVLDEQKNDHVIDAIVINCDYSK